MDESVNFFPIVFAPFVIFFCGYHPDAIRSRHFLFLLCRKPRPRRLSLFNAIISFRKLDTTLAQRRHWFFEIILFIYFYFGKFHGKKNWATRNGEILTLTFHLSSFASRCGGWGFNFVRSSSYQNQRREWTPSSSTSVIIAYNASSSQEIIISMIFILCISSLSPSSCLLIHSTFDFLSMFTSFLNDFNLLPSESFRMETHNAVKRWTLLEFVVCLIYTFFAFRWLGFRMFQFLIIFLCWVFEGKKRRSWSFVLRCWVLALLADCLVSGIF